MGPFEFLSFSVSDYVGHVRINRPPVNALGRDLIRELKQFSQEIVPLCESAEVRALVLSAEGKHFCAGADLKERQSMPVEEVEPTVNATRDMASSVANIPVPVIAAVHGTAVGGGMELALAADIRILAQSARMGLRETALAIIPGAGGTQRLPRLIGPSRAMLWIATGRIFSADECLRDGVANQVVPDEDLLETAMALAKEIAQNGPVAVRAAKEAIWGGLDRPLADGLELEKASYRKTIPTQDRLEALKAFQEKRPPKFEGR